MIYNYADIDEIKEMFFDMIEYMYIERTHPEWIYKTSYIDLVMYNKPLRQYAIYQRDSYQDTIDYVTETKPYHAKIRKTERIYPKEETLSTDVEALHHMHITKYFGNHSRFELNGIDAGNTTPIYATTWADEDQLSEKTQQELSEYDSLSDGTYQGGKFLRNDIEYTASANGFDTGPFNAQARDSAIVTVDTFTDSTRTTLDKKEFYVYDKFGRGYHIPVTFTGTISNFDGSTVVVDQASKFQSAKSKTKRLIALENSNGDVEFMLYDKKVSTNLTIADRGLFTGLSTSFTNGDTVYVLGLLDNLSIVGDGNPDYDESKYYVEYGYSNKPGYTAINDSQE